jgi:hypothetical protein
MQTHNSNDRPNSQRFQFQRELLPPAQTFYEKEIGSLTRPDRKGWSKARCPFHASKSGKSFSPNVDNGAFYCHGCGVKGGDVLAFTMKRYGLSFQSAAKTLGAWKDVTAEERHLLDQQAQRRDREREQAEAAKEAERRRRIQLRDQVHLAGRIWKESCARLAELRRGAMPNHPDEEENCWAAMSLALKDLRETEAEYCAAAGIEYTE